jgi:hypothetical protein
VHPTFLKDMKHKNKTRWATVPLKEGSRDKAVGGRQRI